MDTSSPKTQRQKKSPNKKKTERHEKSQHLID